MKIFTISDSKLSNPYLIIIIICSHPTTYRTFIITESFLKRFPKNITASTDFKVKRNKFTF